MDKLLSLLSRLDPTSKSTLTVEIGAVNFDLDLMIIVTHRT
jgi:hypothetical protein